MVELSWLLPLTPEYSIEVKFVIQATPTPFSSVCLPVILFVGPVIDEESDKEGWRHCEERRANAPQNVWHLRLSTNDWHGTLF